MLSVLMTIYNEGEYADYAIRSCLSSTDIDHLVIVEGAYQQTIKLGKSPRSTDGTLLIIDKYKDHPKVSILYANEQSDPQQRNVGLQKIKELNPNGWLLIVDGDEVYEQTTFKIVKALASNMERNNKYAAYFQSLTFVNDFCHFTRQEFPRLFRITPECSFINDNFMFWKDTPWHEPYIIKMLNISYHHYAFVKGLERFQTKQKWWETRFGKPFDYGWHIDDQGKITDNGHKIFEYKGKHPAIISNHPRMGKQDGS